MQVNFFSIPEIAMRSHGSTLTRKFVLAGILTGAVLLIAYCVYLRDPYAGRRFDPVVWRRCSAAATSYEPENPRARMVSDLLETRLRAGMSRQIVLDLLGDPDERSTYDEVRWLTYYIGGYSGGPVLAGYDYLDIEFDEAGALRTAKVRTSD